MMEAQIYTRKEMIDLLKKYKKQISFRRLEDLANIQHGSIGWFVYRGGKMSQQRFRKIRRAWFGEMQERELARVKRLMKEPLIPNIENVDKCNNEKKDCMIVDLSPWYEKLWLKIKSFVAKLFVRKTK